MGFQACLVCPRWVRVSRRSRQWTFRSLLLSNLGAPWCMINCWTSCLFPLRSIHTCRSRRSVSRKARRSRSEEVRTLCTCDRGSTLLDSRDSLCIISGSCYRARRLRAIRLCKFRLLVVIWCCRSRNVPPTRNVEWKMLSKKDTRTGSCNEIQAARASSTTLLLASHHTGWTLLSLSVFFRYKYLCHSSPWYRGQDCKESFSSLLLSQQSEPCHT